MPPLPKFSENCKVRTITRIVVTGPMEEMQVVFDCLQLEEWKITRSGPKMYKGRATDKFEIHAEWSEK